jgi:hypothetical protein
MDKLENLKKLKALFDDGIISEIEYSEMKSEILSKSDNQISSSQNFNITAKTEAPNKKNGVLTVTYPGKYFLFDANTKLYVNGELHSTHSTKKGFNVKLPIHSESITLKFVLSGMISTTYEIEELDKVKDYFMELIIDETWGNYSSKFNFSENG